MTFFNLKKLNKRKIFYFLIGCLFLLFFFPTPWIVAIVLLVLKYKLQQANIPVWLDIIFWLLPVIVLIIFWVSTYSLRKKMLQEIEFLKNQNTFDTFFVDSENENFQPNKLKESLKNEIIDVKATEETIEENKKE